MTHLAGRPTVMIWHPGATISTADVAAGLAFGLEQHGVNVLWYRTDTHIDAAGDYLTSAFTKRASAGEALDAPTQADILHWANRDILYRALRARREQGLSWVLCVSGMYQHPDFVILLRDAGVNVALIATESPYDAPHEMRLAALVDGVFTCERTMVPAFARVTPHAFYLPHAWHPGVHTMGQPGPQAPQVLAHDVVFVGTYFDERVAFLASIDWTGIDLGLYGNTDDIDVTTADGQRLAPFIRGGYVPNHVTAALYRRAAVGLNLHRRSKGYQTGEYIAEGEAESLNPRCYELAAVGAYFITDYRPEADDVFGGAVATFRTPAECEALIRRALADQAWRAAGAEAAQRAVRGHTWVDRAGRVLAGLATIEQAQEACA